MKRLALLAVLVLFSLALLPTAVQGQGCPRFTLSLTPKAGPVGTSVTFTGTVEITGFKFVLLWNNPEGEEIAQGKAEGYDIAGEFTVPEAPYGSHAIHIHGPGLGESCPAPARFKITPSLSLKPESAPPGTKATLSATGFPADADIEITFGESPLATAKSNSKGSFSTTFTVPMTHCGNHTIRANNAKLAAADIPETKLKVVPAISVDDPAPAVGGKLKVRGYGFAPESEITIKYDDSVVKPEEEKVLTDEKGSFEATIVIPKSPKSSHTLTVSDASGGVAGSNVAVLNLELEKEAPPKPIPVKPMNERFGIFGSKVVTFQWTEVTDPSGITYNLEIGKDLNFFPLERKKTKLEEALYTLTPAEALPMGTYYWRVQAVDFAGNKSEWSISPYPIKVGLIPLWGFVLMGFVALIICLYLLRAIVRFIVSFFRY